MIRLLLLAFLLLGGCAAQAPLPATPPPLQLPMQLHIERHQAEQSQDWVLVIQREPTGLRWSMMDPMGIPQARQLLINGEWQADGLLPPNPEARELFAALMFAMTPDLEMHGRYPTAYRQGMQRRLDDRWLVEYQSANAFTIRLKDHLSYKVTPLNNGTAP
ncbi:MULTISPECIES: hypothetical protein [Pseudomonas syringae group]|uniref:Lipoprotein n=2 Tax=Pseudomonas syringae group TaxID=136849 RepID=A0AB37QTQ2_9PSED|nr:MULTISPECIES: hypothetical protein [Pseudomonas syringae group]KPX30641.1 putative lipoprotein [Pseudomonas coronafaciens pv. garcae]KPZ21935.1 putative lipoprotein [Pseudomonas coronafaciens pv. zizaniae]RMS00188.1 putative lipoprotein [Pseudomonas coronafaciens pv. garcae]RMS04288.1 putative lipoprotein [Pseudomonas coronafaciens pv. garcae]RMS21714.1 putative lipoprotein [Pseudomonas coronafaciens pv. garcae]